MMSERPLPLPSFTRRVLIVVGIALLAAVAGLILILLPRVPLLAFGGVLVAILLQTIADWFCRLIRLPYLLALSLTVLLLIGLCVGTCWFVGDQLAGEADQLTTKLPQSMHELSGRLQRYGWGRQLVAHVEGAWSDFSEKSDGRQWVTRARDWFSEGANALADLVVILFVGLFAALTPEAHVEGALRLVPVRYRPPVRESMHAVGVTLRGWLLGQVVAMVFIGIITAVALWLLGVPLAMVLGVIAAVLNFVPNVGPVVAGIPAMLLALMIGPGHVVWVMGLYIIVQVLQNYVVTPLVQRRAASLPPALLLIAQVLIGMWAGILGLTLAAPLTAAVIVVVDHLYVDRVARKDAPA